MLLPVLILTARGRNGFKMVYATALGCGLANAVLFHLIPSRLAFLPVAPEGGLLALLQSLDVPANVLPSGHVALPASIAVAAFLLGLGGCGKDAATWSRLAWVYAAWTGLLALSILFTKQHLLLDAVVGIGFGIGFAFACRALGRQSKGVDLRSLAALATEWCIVVAAFAVALYWWNVPVVAVCLVVVATRQHALLVLYHDAVHGLFARNRRLNDFIVNTFVGVPCLLPVHLYRALHFSHHAHLGEACDPEKLLLYRGQPWDYRPLRTFPLLVQLVGDLFLWNNLAMVGRYVQALRAGTLRLPRTKAYPELALQFLLAGVLVAWMWRIHPEALPKILFLWFLPFLTLTQFLQKLRSFAEHAAPEDDASRSCSWEPGWLGRQFLWPYNINFHREHHLRADVPWSRLPELVVQGTSRPGRELVKHLWRRA
jgi:fatty acid desaturase